MDRPAILIAGKAGFQFGSTREERVSWLCQGDYVFRAQRSMSLQASASRPLRNRSEIKCFDITADSSRRERLRGEEGKRLLSAAKKGDV